MAKKQKKEKEESFDLETAIEEYPMPDWYKKAFLRTVDISKIKNNNDLSTQIKKFGEMKI